MNPELHDCIDIFNKIMNWFKIIFFIIRLKWKTKSTHTS